MGTIFISHSTKDTEKVKKLMEFLQVGMGIGREQIFCTSVSGTLRPGTDFIQSIKEAMKDCKVVIPLISENYMKSNFCFMELGAAWILSGEQVDGKEMWPLLTGNIKFDDLKNTPLSKLQMLCLESQDDVAVLYDVLCDQKLAGKRNTPLFNQKLPEFMERIRAKENDSDVILHSDEQGYYLAEIAEIRSVPPSYRCYRIRGLVESDLFVGYQSGETHWIFFHAGIYEDLSVGDCVRFKFSKTELKQHPDLKNARDIYPSDLKKVKNACMEKI